MTLVRLAKLSSYNPKVTGSSLRATILTSLMGRMRYQLIADNHCSCGRSQHKGLISNINIEVQEPITWSSNSDTLLYSALVNYQQYYDDTTHKKVYLGGMHIFSSDLLGNTAQLTQGDHLFKQPIFSPDEKHIAYLYADKLNARTLQLNTMLADGSKQQVLRQSVAKNAVLQWY